MVPPELSNQLMAHTMKYRHATLFFPAIGIAENVTVVQTTVGHATCHHAQGICQTIIDSYDVGQHECQTEVYRGAHRSRNLCFAESI